MSLRMTDTEREGYLAGIHVGVLAVAEPGRGPLVAPIWYGYEPGGELWIVTGRGSRKGRLLEAAGRFSLCVQSEQPPYRYVSVEGPITSVVEADVERDTRPLARRYLGEGPGDRYVEATAEEEAPGGSVRIAMRPERWLTVDYGKLFGPEAAER